MNWILGFCGKKSQSDIWFVLRSWIRSCLDVIMLRDIMSWAVTQEDGEASVTERRIQPPSSQGYCSYIYLYIFINPEGIYFLF